MSYSSLADFLEIIEQTDELARIDAPLDPSEFSRADETAEKSVFLSHVEGSRFPMAGPLMTDPGRVCQAIGVSNLHEAASRVEQWLQKKDRWTKEVARAEVQQVVRLASDLDGGVLPKRLSGMTLFSIDPATGERVGVAAELELDGPTRLVQRWTAEVGVTPIRDQYVQQGQPMPMAICAGGDPAIYLASVAPTPQPVDPCVLGAVLRGRSVEVVPCRTLDKITVPAQADLVIEAVLIGDVIEIRAVTHRINPVLPFAIPKERAIVRRAVLQTIVPWWRAELPGLADLALPEWGEEASVLVAAVEKAYLKEAERIAEALADHPVWASERTIVLVDQSVCLTEEAAVLRALLKNVDFGRRTLLAIDH